LYFAAAASVFNGLEKEGCVKFIGDAAMRFIGVVASHIHGYKARPQSRLAPEEEMEEEGTKKKTCLLEQH
jgi:hypothetical protein